MSSSALVWWLGYEIVLSPHTTSWSVLESSAAKMRPWRLYSDFTPQSRCTGRAHNLQICKGKALCTGESFRVHDFRCLSPWLSAPCRAKAVNRSYHEVDENHPQPFTLGPNAFYCIHLQFKPFTSNASVLKVPRSKALVHNNLSSTATSKRVAVKFPCFVWVHAVWCEETGSLAGFHFPAEETGLLGW